MGFNTTLTAGDLTRVNAGTYAGRQYLAYLPHRVVFRAQINQASFGLSLAELTYDTVTVGAFGDIVAGMTVYIGTTNDYNDAAFVGRIRKAATSTLIYINETSAAFADNMIITVLDDYRIAERLERVDVVTQTLYKDYDIAYTPTPPLIAGLQSAYILPTTAASASIAFAPTATAMTHSATITGWLWNVADGTITVGTTTTQNITVSFPAGNTPRWVSVRVTDSNSSQHTMRFVVFCGNPDTATWSLTSVDGVSVTHSLEDGSNADLTAWANAGISTLPDDSLCVLYTIPTFGSDGTVINTNVDIVGRLKRETVSTGADVFASVLSDVRFELQGYAQQLATIPVPNLPFLQSATPTTWGDVNRPTPARVTAFILIWHTTYASVASVSFNSDANDYVYPDLSLNNNGTSALEAVNKSQDSINAAMEFSGDGQSRCIRNANYLTTSARNALSTIVDIQANHITSYDYEDEYELSTGTAIGGFGSYNLTSSETKVYEAKAPAETRASGIEDAQLNSQITKVDLTETQARQEAGERTANHFAYINPKPRITVTFALSSWRFLVPSAGYWFTFTLPASLNARGVALTNATRWLLTSATYTYENSEGGGTVTAEFMQETQSLSYQTMVSLVPATAPLEMPVLFMGDNYPSLGLNPSVVLPPAAGFNLPLTPRDFDFAQPVPPPLADVLATAGCWTRQLRAQDTVGIFTPNTSVGTVYTITVRGETQKEYQPEWYVDYDFTTSKHGFEAENSTVAPIVPIGTWVSGTGWVHANWTTGGCWFRGVLINRDYGTAYNWTKIEATYDAALGSNSCAPTLRAVIWYSNASLRTSLTGGTNITTAVVGTDTDNLMRVGTMASATGSLGSLGGFVTLKKLRLHGVGAAPAGAVILPPPPNATEKMDAFYWKYNTNPNGLADQLPLPRGIKVNGNNVALPSAYDPNHEYTFTHTGNGNQIQFVYDTGGDSVTDTAFSVRVCGDDTGDW